jgi:lysozyme
MDAANLKALRDTLIVAEGRKPFPYRDTAGKLTIGVGRNLTDNGLYDDEIDLLLTNDIDRRVLPEAQRRFPWFDDLDPVRERAHAELLFNMGYWTLSQFHHYLDAMARRDWATARTSLHDSKWATQVGPLRSTRLECMIETGKEPLVIR